MSSRSGDAEQSERSRPDGFHYDRGEREGLGGRRTEESGGRAFRHNRGLLITLLDLIVILIMFVLYVVLVLPALGNQEIAGFRFSGRAFEYDGEVFVTVEITRTDRSTSDSAPPRGAESLVEVVFPDGATVTDVLPSPGSSVRVRHVLPEPVEEVPVKVTALGESIELLVNVRAED